MSRTSALIFLLFTGALAGNAALASPPDGAEWGVRWILAVLALAAGVAVAAPAALRPRIAAAVTASLLGLFAIEAYEWGFGLFEPPNYPESYDPRTKFEVVLDLRDRGVEAYPTIHPAAYIAPRKIAGVVTMPFGGVVNAVTVYCKENESGQYLVYDSDEQGFNNPRGLWQRSSVEVALVGDSFTQGACALEGSFASHLRRRFDGVLNLGSGNNGPLIELATIKEYLQEFRPPVVLWFYYEGNDLANLKEERQSALLLRYLAGNFRQGLRQRQSEIDLQVRSFVNRSVAQLRAAGSRGVVHEEPYGAREFARLALTQKHLGHLALRSRLGGEPAKTSPSLRLFARILAEANQTVASWHGKLYFVYLPAYEYLRRGETEAQRDGVLEAARSHGIPIIDIDALFRARAAPLELFPFNQDGVHYTQEGNRLIADRVIQVLASEPR